MTLRLKSLRLRNVIDGSSDRLFHPWTERKVDHFPAIDAQQMVMVFGEILRELESGELVLSCDSAHQSGTLKIDETAVGRTPRKVGELVADVPDAYWMTNRGK